MDIDVRTDGDDRLENVTLKADSLSLPGTVRVLRLLADRLEQDLSSLPPLPEDHHERIVLDFHVGLRIRPRLRKLTPEDLVQFREDIIRIVKEG